MRISKLFLAAAGLYGLYKLVEFLKLEYEEEVSEVRINLIPTARLPEEDEYYDPEYTLDEDILDELEELEPGDYNHVVEQMGKELAEEDIDEPMIAPVQTPISKRQDQILKLFEKSPKLEVEQISKRIKGTTVRTIRRDLTKLEEIGKVKKVGKTKGSYYMKLS
jgi:DNA-binding transcriptional ArsR family regulator